MSEATAIETAFEEQVETLFKGLVQNLGDVPVSHQTDQECLEAFARGLNLARKAKLLALKKTAPA
jgi:hypothetical protein